MRKIKLLFCFFILLSSACKKENKTTTTKTEISKEKKIVTILKKDRLIPSKEILLGEFNYKKDSLFDKVPKKYSSKTIYIRKVVLDSFIKMSEAAKKEEISFKIISGTRNFKEQKAIWERKWKTNNISDSTKNALKILTYSSMPSTSRHHWGTDIDINNLNNSYFTNGKGKKEYEWLSKNAHKFGFFQPYTSKKNGRTGYNEEKWHWSFRPISKIYLDSYNENIKDIDIDGFIGSNTAKKIKVIKNYVNGIVD